MTRAHSRPTGLLRLAAVSFLLASLGGAQTKGGPISSSFLGGPNGTERITAVAVAPNGDTVVVGNTTSASFPTTPGAFDSTYSGHRGGRGTGDGFVAKISADGRKLIFATYFGGNEGDELTDVRVDAGGAVTFSGFGYSTDIPTTANAYRRAKGAAGSDSFVARLSADGKTLLYGSYFGPTGRHRGSAAYGVHFDPAKQWIYLVGTTTGALPTTAGAYDRVDRSSLKSFVSILDLRSKPGATVLHYSTYVGGTNGNNTSVTRTHVDSRGVVTVAGLVDSKDWPTTAGAYQTQKKGLLDAFVYRLDPGRAGNAGLRYGTYFAGFVHADRFDAGLDASGRIYLVGSTTWKTMPVTSGAFQAKYAGGTLDGFVALLDPAKQGAAQLAYGSYLGGPRADSVRSAHVSPGGVVTLVGETNVSRGTGSFPTTAGAFQGGRPGGGFFVRFHPFKRGGAALVYSTQLVFCGSTEYRVTRYDEKTGSALIAGRSTGTTLARPGAFQESNTGDDGFVMRFGPKPLPPATRPFGASCRGTTGTPALVARSHAELCQPYSILLTRARPNQPAIMFLGFSKTAWGPIRLPLALDFLGMNGCSLYTGGEVITGMTTGTTGTTSYGFGKLPAIPALIGASFFNQCIFVDQGANKIGLVSTNGIEAEIRA